MKPWREELPEELDDDLQREASSLLARSAQVPGWMEAEKSAVWKRLQSNGSAAPESRARWLPRLALVSSTALLVFALIYPRAPSAKFIRRSPAPSAAATAPEGTREGTAEWTPVDIGRVGKLRVAASAIYRLPATLGQKPLAEPTPGSEYRIALDDGTLCAEIAHRDLAVEGPLLVQTPQMEVVVVGTRFCVEAHRGISTVSVTEGRVRVQTAAGSVFVGAGEKLGSDDARLVAVARAPIRTELRESAEPLSAPKAASKAAQEAASEAPRRPADPLVATRNPAPLPTAPLAAIAPSSLAEQNALYALGTQARDRHEGPAALTAWRAYLIRFPDGVLAPEASAGALGELVSEGRQSEALIAADEYLGRFPADGRAAEVAFIRGNLLHDKQDRIADALAAYRQALALATRPGLRDDALFAVGVCERMIGHTAQAQDTFRQYQHEFPSGAHARELSRWLAQ